MVQAARSGVQNIAEGSMASATSKKTELKSDGSDRSDRYCIATASPEVAANTLICLVNQASFLRGRQLQKLEQTFLEEGGFPERLYRERQARRRPQR